MTAALADLALRRPHALLLGSLAVLALSVGLAIGAPNRLVVGSVALDERGGGPDLAIATRASFPVTSRVYQVALRVVSSQLRTDPAVSSVRQGPVTGHGRVTALEIALVPDDAGDRQDAVLRLEDSVDPGPLKVSYGGEVPTLSDAREVVAGELWRLELLALPFALLVLAAALGLRVAAGAAIACATSIAGCLAVLRLLDAFADVSLLAIAPAAVVGLVLAIEVSSLLAVRLRDEREPAPRGEAMERALLAAARSGGVGALAAAVAVTGLLGTGLDQAPSLVLASAVAGALAVGSAVATVPALLGLAPDAAGVAVAGLPGESRVARAPTAAVAWLARSPRRTIVAVVVGTAALLALAAPTLHGSSKALVAAELPAETESRVAAQALQARGGSARPGSKRPGRAAAAPPAGTSPAAASLFEDLPLAAAISAIALALALLAAYRSMRALPTAPVALLPAAAACGLAVLVFQDGHLAGPIGQEAQGALGTGAVATMLAALAGVAAARCVATLSVVREERGLGMARERAAEKGAGFTLRGTIAATLVAGAATGVLAGSDLYAVREFGLAVAAGLVLDLVLVRPALLAALARWGAG